MRHRNLPRLACLVKKSRKDAAQLFALGYALERDHVRRHARRDVFILRHLPDLVEGFDYNLFERAVYLVFLPCKGLNVLHPFEIRNDNAAGVREYVGNNYNALFGENPVAFDGCRAVRALDDYRRLDIVCVIGGYPVFERGGISISASQVMTCWLVMLVSPFLTG